jgi:hypothetical protein
VRTYIAGPINGYPNLNREAFEEAEARLHRMGHIPINPHKVKPREHPKGECTGDLASEGHGYGCYMIPDLKELLDCQAYTLLEGWELSRGAVVEEQVARICGLLYVVI